LEDDGCGFATLVAVDNCKYFVRADSGIAAHSAVRDDEAELTIVRFAAQDLGHIDAACLPAVISANHADASIPASEIEAGMELHLPCLVKVGQGNNGYKTVGEFLPEAAD